MSRNRKSSAVTGSVSPAPQQDDAATVPPVTEAASGPAGSQMPAGDTIVAQGVSVTTIDTMPPEGRASTSGTEIPSQGDAADGAGANAGPADVFKVVGDTIYVADIADVPPFARLGQRLVELLAPLGVDPDDFLSTFAAVRTETVRAGLELVNANIGDVSTPGILSTGDGPARIGGMRVKSKVDGFRRGGIAHTRAGRDFGPDELTPEQVRLIMSDPGLTVELL